MSKKHRAVFLDRDGTLIEDRGHIGDVADVVFLPQTFEALSLLAPHFQFFIVTHQGGVGKGILTMDAVERVGSHVTQVLARQGIDIRQTYCCPHARSEGCRCVKPKPYFLHLAAERYDLDLARSFVVGDHPHDVEFARNGGATGIYVLTGHGQRHRAELAGEEVIIASDVLEAAHKILRLDAGDWNR